MIGTQLDRLRAASRIVGLLLVGTTALVGLLTNAYVSEPHSPRRTAFALGCFIIVALLTTSTLLLLRHRWLAYLVALVSTLVLVFSVASIRQWQEDFAEVVPLPLIEQPLPIRGARLPESPAPVSPLMPENTPATDPSRPVRPSVDLTTRGPLDFPQFLGPGRTASIDGVILDPNWAARPPVPVWRHPVGAAWSAFAIVNSYAVTLEQRGEYETVSLYSAESGTELWSHRTRARYQNPEWPQAGIGPRSTPTIDEGRVYALGATGRLVCLDGANGALIWEHDLLAESGQTAETEQQYIPFGRSASPLVARNLVIVPVGGRPGHASLVSLAAFDKRTGKKVWTAGTRQISMSSPALMTLAGVEQIVVVNEDAVTGHDLETGTLLWEQAWEGNTQGPTNVAQAMPVSGNRFFVSRSYSGGSAVYEVSAATDGTLTTREVWKSSRVMRTRFTNVAIRDGHAYGLSDGILECINLENGQRVWKTGRYGHGQVLLVGDLVLVQTEDGEVVVVEASPRTGGEVLGRFAALEGTSWNNLALYGSLLLVRNASEAAAYRLPLAPGLHSPNVVKGPVDSSPPPGRTKSP